MIMLIFAAFLLLLTLASLLVRKTYNAVPAHELKRLARKGDAADAELYRAVAYGASLRGLLWLISAVSGGLGLILLSRAVSPLLSLLTLLVLLYVGFSWLPASNVSRFSRKLTLVVTPALVWILAHVFPVLSRAVAVAQKPHTRRPHTGFYERNDLLRLIEQQQTQADSRLSPEELEIVRRALQFSDHTVADILTQRKQIPSVLASDTVGPILIDELHKSGKPYALVRDSAKGPLVGSIDIAKLGIHAAGTINNLMNPTLYYLHVDDNLTEALHIFFQTNHALFVVINSAEEFVGIVSIEDVLKQLIGHVPGDEFDQYSDPAAVAARHTATVQNKLPEGSHGN